MNNPKRKSRPAHEATVTGSTQLSPSLVRVHMNSPGLVGVDAPFTDHYVKLLFPPAGADYSWPFDQAEIKDTRPRAEWPVTRTYTFRRVDTTTGDFDLDFVLHGDTGLAAPWAAEAEAGQKIGFSGPGGKWHPEAEYEHFVLAGDESSAPAIAAALEVLPENTTAQAYIEIESDDEKFEMPSGEGITVNWVSRNGTTPGTEMSAAVRADGYPEKKTSWFIHGVAEMIKEMRRFLFVEGDIERDDVSISGYWRLGMTEDQWQASKQEFNSALEESERAQNS